MERLAAPRQISANECVTCHSPVEGARCAQCGAVQLAGGYRVERLLASTPHSRVYLAHDDAGQAVALKELIFAQVPGVKELEAFEREVETLKRLEHAAIPRLVASFREGAGPGLRLYLASTYFSGESLADRLTHGTLAEPECRALALQLLSVLRYLQSRTPAVVHRDIKPANVMFRPDGTLGLVDFGSARLLEGPATHRSTLVGTFGYMAPEQLGGSVDLSSDVYGVAATMLHALTGHPPQELLEPDLTLRLPSTLSPQWKWWLEQALAPHAKQRFQDATSAFNALAQPFAPQRTRWSRTLTLGAVLMFSAGAWVSTRNAPKVSTPAPVKSIASESPPTRVEHDPDLALLETIRLPEHATPEQVRVYITKVLAASRNQFTYLKTDPQVAMLTSLGAANASLLLEAIDDNVPLGEYPAWALARVVPDELKGQVIQALSTKRRAAIVVYAKGWQREAKRELIDGLRGYRGWLPGEWLEALVSLQDPETHEVLTQYLIHGWNRHSTYRLLAGVAGLDLSQALPQAWDESRSSASKWETAYLTPAALSYGHLPALEFTFDSLDDNASMPRTEFDARSLVTRFTEARGSDADLKAWFAAHRNSLQFDRNARRFTER